MKVLYSVEINDKCPPYLEYVTAMANGRWSMQQANVELVEKDRIKVSVLVEYQEEIYKATENIILEEDGVQKEDQQTESSTDRVKTTEGTEKTTCKVSVTTRAGVPVCSGDLIFEQNFDLMEDLLKNWDHDIRLRLNDLWTEEFVVFNDEERNNFIRNGVLNIVPTLETYNIRDGELNLTSKCTAYINPARDCYRIANQHHQVLPPVQSAQIHTRLRFMFKYGHVVIRAKLPKGDWILPYILLRPFPMPVDLEGAPQIRVAFARGNSHLLDKNNDDIGGSRLYGGVIYGETKNHQPIMMTLKDNKHFGDDFHVYSIDWTESGISFAVDDKKYGEVTTHLESFKEEFFLILGVSVGGHTQFPDDSLTPKPWTNTSPKAALDFWKKRNSWIYTWNGNEGLQIDYVKVYAI